MKIKLIALDDGPDGDVTKAVGFIDNGLDHYEYNEKAHAQLWEQMLIWAGQSWYHPGVRFKIVPPG
jgi:hypothetical protein